LGGASQRGEPECFYGSHGKGSSVSRAANPLAAVIAERGIKLERRGRHLFALCPLHQEASASFVVTESKGLFHCFGCGAGGDVIGFVVRYDRVSFPEALQKLAARAGLEVAAREPQQQREDMSGRTSWR
jgi:DNA primase